MRHALKDPDTHISSIPTASSGKQRILNALYFLGIAVYLVLVSFQGFDLLDEGFHVTFYQQFFRDPESVQYSFFYWFSGLVGGLIVKWFPQYGLIGLRIAGAACIFLTILVANRMLKPYVNGAVLKIAFLLLALLINTEPKDIYYNIVSALIFFTAAWAMFSGLNRGKVILIFVSGALLAINIFTRTPNLLGLGLALVIAFDWWQKKYSTRKLISYGISYAAGAVTGLLLVYLLMVQLGHWTHFVRALGFLTEMSGTTDKTDGLEGGYGIGKMIYSPLKQYLLSVAGAILVVALAGFLFLLLSFRKYLPAWSRTIVRIIPVSIVLFVLWLIVTDRLKIELLIYLYTGVSLLGFVFIMFFSRSHQVKLLSIIGMFIVIVHPFGSAPGIVSVVIYSLWLSFPLALQYISRISGLEVNLKSVFPSRNMDLSFSISQAEVRNFGLALAFLTSSICIFHLFRYPYFYDHHWRTELKHPIRNPWVKHIYTSEARAKSLNDALTELGRYVSKDDYLLAYDAIPMFHFMTETRPYLNNPSPMFYSNSIFRKEMQKAIAAKPLPVVIRHKIKTVHEGSKWPEELVVGDYFTDIRSRYRNEYFNEFLTEKKYREVWSNETFAILVPPGKEANQK